MSRRKTVSPRSLALATLALGTAVSALSTGPAWAAPTTEPFGEIPGTSESLFQDDANVHGAPLVRFYYLPRRTVIERKAIDIDPVTGAADLSFDLRLVKSEALEAAEAGLKEQAARLYGVDAAQVQFLPLPLLESRTTLSRSASLVSDAILPEDGTPVGSPLTFEVSYTPQGASNFRSNVVLGNGLFATYTGYAKLLEPASGEVRSYKFPLTIVLKDLAYCEVTAGGCSR